MCLYVCVQVDVITLQSQIEIGYILEWWVDGHVCFWQVSTMLSYPLQVQVCWERAYKVLMATNFIDR